MVGTSQASLCRVRILRCMMVAMLWCLGATAHASTDAGVYAFPSVPVDLGDPMTEAKQIHAPAGVGARSVHLRAVRVPPTSPAGPGVRGLLPLGGIAAFALVAPLLWRRKRPFGIGRDELYSPCR
jgi:hypothetical protein